MLFIMVFGSNQSCLVARLGFLRYFLTLFLLVHFTFLSILVLKTDIYKSKSFTEAGAGGRGQKSVTYYLNGPFALKSITRSRSINGQIFCDDVIL